MLNSFLLLCEPKHWVSHLPHASHPLLVPSLLRQ